MTEEQQKEQAYQAEIARPVQTEEQLLDVLRKVWTYRSGKLSKRDKNETDYDEIVRLIEVFYMSEYVCEQCSEYMLDVDTVIAAATCDADYYKIKTFNDWETFVDEHAKEHAAVCEGSGDEEE